MSERVLVTLVRELAPELGLTLEEFSQGWILRLSRGGITRHIYGFALELNPAAAQSLATDKSAACELLSTRGVAAVEHRVFLHPRLGPFAPAEGNWGAMLSYAEARGFDIVVKDNAGTGGLGVYHVRAGRELEHAVYGLFQRVHAVALSPFVRILDETRYIILDGVCEVAYRKVRPAVTGDGVHTVLELVSQRAGRATGLGKALRGLDPEALDRLSDVPPPGVEVVLSWKHNLQQGAEAKVLSAKELAERSDRALAVEAARVLNMRFCSVDVVTTPGGPRVMEVNAGVMMESLAREHEGGMELARRVYRRALEAMFTREQ